MSDVPTKSGNPRILSYIGLGFGVLALLILPIILGPIGAILGFVGYARGDKPFGLYVGIGCLVATVAGIAIAAAVLNGSS